MWLTMLRNPRGVSRRCSSNPFRVSVGPFDVPGVIEERQDVITAMLHRLLQRTQLIKASRNPAVDAGDQLRS